MSANINLWLSVLSNNLDRAEKALIQGANPNTTGPRGFSMLHIAAEKDNNMMAQLLLENGAYLTRPRSGYNALAETLIGGIITGGVLPIITHMTQKYPFDVTALEIAADRQNHDFIRLMAHAYRNFCSENSPYGARMIELDFSRAIKQSLARCDRETYNTLQAVKFDILAAPPQNEPNFIQGLVEKVRDGWTTNFYATRPTKNFTPTKSP
jgi:ankyrin repeat protein